MCWRLRELLEEHRTPIREHEGIGERDVLLEALLLQEVNYGGQGSGRVRASSEGLQYLLDSSAGLSIFIEVVGAEKEVK